MQLFAFFTSSSDPNQLLHLDLLVSNLQLLSHKFSFLVDSDEQIKDVVTEAFNKVKQEDTNLIDLATFK
jgi:hypothetical protein